MYFLVAAFYKICIIGRRNLPRGSTAMANLRKRRLNTTLDMSKPYHDLREQVLEALENMYFEQHLEAEDWSIAAVARETGVDRSHLYRILRRRGFIE